MESDKSTQKPTNANISVAAATRASAANTAADASASKNAAHHLHRRRILARRSSTLVDSPAENQRIEEKPLITRAGRGLATSIFDNWVRISTTVTRTMGWKPRVTPYIGYGTEKYARLICRTVFAPRNTADAVPISRGARAALMVPAAYVPVSITIDGVPLASVQIGTSEANDPVDSAKNLPVNFAISDSHGYLDLVAEGTNRPGVHDVEYTVEGRRPIHASLYTVSSSAKIGIISDIDDTVLVTDVPEVFVAAKNMLFTNPRLRRAVTGMPEFYRALDAQLDGRAPFFYLSTSPWNIEPALRRFIDVNDFPRGPLMLRDFDPRPKTFIPTGTQHKLEFCAQLMDDFPNMRFILIGDNGQHDPQTYAEVVRKYPRRVLAIGIRQLQSEEPMHFSAALHAMPNVGVPVFFGRTGGNLARTMLPFLQQELGLDSIDLADYGILPNL